MGYCVAFQSFKAKSTSGNTVKSQIYIALITYILLELIKRTKSKINMTFSNLSEKIRLFLYPYFTIDYIVTEIRNGVRKVKVIQKEINFERDLFSG